MACFAASWLGNQSFDFKHFQTDAVGALPANLFPLGSWIIVALRQLRLYGGLVNRSKSLTAFKTIDEIPLASGFLAAAPHCPGPAGPEISKAVSQRCENNSKHLGQVVHAITGSEGQSIKHQYHSIGKQRHVGSRSEFDRGGPACSSGASRIKDLVAKGATWQHHCSRSTTKRSRRKTASK